MVDAPPFPPRSYRGYFVDLFVRSSNTIAIKMYLKLGYTVYRRVLGYYSGDSPEDAFDMRKALPRDVDRASTIPMHRPIRPDEVWTTMTRPPLTA